MGYQIARGNAWHFYYFRYTERIKTHFYKQNFKSFKINASWNFSYKMTSLQWSRFAVSFIPQPLLLSMKICRDNMEASRLTQYRSSHKKEPYFLARCKRAFFQDDRPCHSFYSNSFVSGLTLTCPSSCGSFMRNIDTITLNELSHHLIKIKCANSIIAFQSTDQIEKNRVYKGKTID